MHSQPYPAPVIGHPSTDPVDEIANCQQAIRAADWWTNSGLSEHWPLTTAEAAELLSVAGQFDVDADGLCDLIERRLLARPGQGEVGELEWNAADLIAAGGLLEMRGQWRPTPSGHDPKKHVCQILLEQARNAGQVNQIVDAPGGVRFDVRHLLALLAACDSREGRMKTIALLKAVLEIDHGVYVS